MTGYDAYAMGMPLHSHRDIHIIMPLMVIVIGQVIHRHRYASTHSFVFSLVSEIVRLGIALIQWSWGAVAGWLASRTIDPRVVSSNPGRSVTCGCVPGQNTLPLIARVFSDRTLKIVGPFYLVSMPGEVKDPTRVINNVTRSGLWAMGELCAPPTAVGGAA